MNSNDVCSGRNRVEVNLTFVIPIVAAMVLCTFVVVHLSLFIFFYFLVSNPHQVVDQSHGLGLKCFMLRMNVPVRLFCAHNIN